ncbi:MAG TPA: hypothetical protein VGE26_07215 [Sphingobacteriaceae bacterium]
MKKNIYFREVFSRPNVIKDVLLNIFLMLSIFFRIPIEVITRKNMGERYFSLFFSVIIGLVLVITPYSLSSRYRYTDWSGMFTVYGTWYLFTAAYIFSLYLRWKEVKHDPSVFDFEKFSLSTGRIHPLFKSLEQYKWVNERVIEIIIEPGVFLVAGVILAYFGQPVGLLLIACAVVYSLGYMAAYNLGDNFVMDQIDEMLCNEEMIEVFVKGKPSDKGVKFYARKPESEALREELADRFIVNIDEDEDVVLAV